MTEADPTTSKYSVTIKDARGIVIGGHNTIYPTFLSDQYAPLAHKLITFTTLIEEKSQGFVGRRFVFDALDQFMERTPAGYFIVKGEAGIGKSALMAHLVQAGQYVHHFVVSTQGINRADQFLENICAQLIARYKLDRPAWLPPEASRDSAFLSALLQEVSEGLAAGEQVLILVDALDEVDWRGRTGENVLLLPPALPPGVFVAVTMRRKEGLPLQVDRSQIFYLDPDSDANREDVRAYIRQFAQREVMQPSLSAWGTTVEAFVKTMLAKSEGNFMYLRYVLPAIERGEFRHGTLAELPQGLKDYYERHWRQIRAIDEDRWVDYRQPVICFLAMAQEPVTVWQIASWAKLKPARVLSAIRDWREFLDEDPVAGVMRYRIYHQSFQDFLAAKDEARDLSEAESPQ
ncbi:MAG: ATP-binding protein [Anaerolineae bacterium]